jgi:hypothetical protein
LRGKVAAKLPEEGYLSTKTVLVDATPLPNEFLAGIGDALSRKGRGHYDRHR